MKESKQKKQRLVKNILLNIKIEQMIKQWKKRIKKSRQRVNILKQWSKTQQDYIKDLKIIVQKIQKPLLSSKLITNQQDRVLFPNLNAMIKLSQQMLNTINHFLSKFNPHHTLIGDSLSNFHKYFIIYREYCNNFYKAQKIMKEVRKLPSCSTLLKQLPMDIQSYIIKPVQRPPKYQLLLRQYQKALPKDHKDYQSLTKAIQKYHEVNEQNNQSMDLQIRNQKMIELDNRFGGIINNTRIYLFQEYVKSIQFKAKLYVFNDLILVVKVFNDQKQQKFKNIQLDGQSFIDIPMDGKYITNKLFICGIKQNFHINFVSYEQRDKIQKKLQNIINQLYRKQSNRIKNIKKNKIHVTKIDQFQNKNKTVVRATAAGVEKRPNGGLNVNNQVIYIIKIQSSYPNNIFQYINTKFDELLSLQKQLRMKNKLLGLPFLDNKPQDMSLYDVKKNKTKIIQYRMVYIERFINYILRTQQLQQYIQSIIKRLKINQEFWKFANAIQICTCNTCGESKDNSTIQQFQMSRSKVRNIIGLMSDKCGNQYKTVDRSTGSTADSNLVHAVCLFNNFTLNKRILEAPVQELNTLSRRLTWLQCKLGRIDYSLIVPRNQLQRNIKVTIQLLSLKPDETVCVRISPISTVVQVLDQIAQIYQIQTLRDFCLILELYGVTRIMDRDQRLWEVLKEVQYPIDQPYELKDLGEAFIKKKINDLKKWSELMIGKKPKLYLKKCIFMSNQLEIKTCEQNPQRYSLMVQEVFYRFKNQTMILDSNGTKKLCALYYILNYMDKLPYLNQANFQLEKLKNLLPSSKWHLLNDSDQFGKSIYICIKQNQKKMDELPLPSIRNKSSSSNLFSKVQIINNLILNLAFKVMSWSTIFFEVTNYDPKTLPQVDQNLLLGINKKYLIIIRHKQLTPLIQIQLNELTYKITVMSIFIQKKQKILRFDGQMMLDVKKIIQIYKILYQKFKDN